MWPWAHLALGYLCLSLSTRWRDGDGPDGQSALVVAFATQFPDLIDKPFAWTVPLLPNGRSLAHSLLTAAVVVALVWTYARHRDRDRLGAAFAIGYLSHLLGDAYLPLLSGDLRSLGFLAWPIVPPIEYSTGKSVGAHVGALDVTPAIAFGVALFCAGSVLWAYDGAPGLRASSRTVS